MTVPDHLTDPITVGEFTYQPETGAIRGPAEFLASPDFARWSDDLHAGRDVVFVAGLEHSPSPEVAMLVSLQTCFAAWRGSEQMRRLLADFEGKG